ncbi:hypothetical protein Tco_0242007, partial [Tanacetum coccineum]
MDDPNITMEEYIRVEEEKAHKHGKVFNWETAKVFNDSLTSNETPSCEPTGSSLDNNEIEFRISFEESDDEDYMVVFDKNLFSYKIISTNDLKTDSENDNEKVNKPLFSSPKPTVEGYTKEIVHNFEQRLEMIFGRQVNRVHILDFEGLTLDMRQDLADRMRMVYTGEDRQEEFILEFFSTCRIGDEMGLDVAGTLCFQFGGARRMRVIPDKEDLSDYLVDISPGREFLRGAPLYTYIRDPVRRLCHRLISDNISRRGQAPEKVAATDLFYLRSMDRGETNVLYLLAQYLFRHTKRRKSCARLSRGNFIGRLAHHFGLVSDDGLGRLSVVAHELPLINMGELVKLNICMEIRYDWAWVAPGLERQQVATASAPEATEDAPSVDE